MTKCIYHSKDLDGRCSGAIVKRSIPDCEMIGMDYGDVLPWDIFKKDDELIMIDFSLPFKDMMRLNGMVGRFVWIDHHKSAIKEYEKYKEKIRGNGIFTPFLSEELAACELTWAYLCNDEIGVIDPTHIPCGIRFLGRYDIWDHSNPDAVLFQLGMLSYDTSVESDIWEEALGDDEDFISNTIFIGKRVQEFVQSRNEWNMKFSFPFEFEGIRFICINNVTTGSPQFDSVWDPDKYDAVMVFYMTPEKRWSFHIYTSKKEIDLSVIATKYGGGGHTNACGFQLNELPF